ncbi:TPA: hypothetical protein ACPYPK_001033 [Legionella pneumophila]|uniref:hypothetical protein n=1 Tax=Legionella pneumophila TaxID=446 RepID=UPI000875D088|nr:hypothetical protein [Legionella pneumophila]AOW57841.1 hypothetical protein BE843_05980 [Legionella pneumophila subsp. pneumophila]AOW61975.1 hypothetical protein BE844_12790 [Legionella pneumophila subsp. pneumophila]AOW67373.1 hypothetical protein BE846_10555 [Legionella pneumophila subsp. pneumophila]HAT2038729.1 hypothetical protein [Legionella pneumophila]HCW6766646.1 hypothetical protein [Legionella pneumophila]
MQKLMSIFLFLFFINSFAFDHSYDVSGEDENGRSYGGTIYSNNGERSVSGELEDENGNSYEFNGDWEGEGYISGETDEGVSVDLNIN